MKARTILLNAALFGAAAGYGLARFPSEVPMSAEQRSRIRAVEQSVHYDGCNEVRALGKAPLYRGQPGYGAHMDGDGDGIACEPYH